MEDIHKNGIEAIEYLQTRLNPFSDMFVWISWIGDPVYAYLLYFPIIYSFNHAIGIKVLWGTAIAEWLNHIAKWFFYGERPYWWVGEHSSVWENENIPKITQFPITCETGPGSPSGHMMIASSSLFIVMRFLETENNKENKDLLHSFIIWAAYISWMVCVAVSRVFIAAHFPHQCIAGFLAGALLGYCINKLPVEKLSLRQHLIISGLLLLSAIISHTTLTSLGFDPGWTFPLAVKWCLKRSWVHLTTTPFFMMWRYVSTILGIGFGLHSKLLDKRKLEEASPRIKLTLVLVNVIFTLVCDQVFKKTKFENFAMAYASCFLTYSIVPYVVISVIPYLVMNWFVDDTKGKGITKLK